MQNKYIKQVSDEMKLETAKEIANDFLKLIRPFCLRAEIAGSIRREKPEVKDVEICAVPRDLWELKNIMYIQCCIKGEVSLKVFADFISR